MSQSHSPRESEDEIPEQNENPANEEEEGSSVQSEQSQGRGRRRVPESWTRVISFEFDNLRAQHKYQLNNDLILSQNLPRHIRQEEETDWKPFFLSKDFLQENLGITLENFKLSTADLL